MSTKISVHALIKNNNNEVFLTQRNDVPLWVMPGGTVRAGENLEDTLFREVEEETGYEIGEPVQAVKTTLGLAEKYVYSVAITGGTPVLDPKEVRKAGWFNIDKLPIPMSVFEKDRLIKAFNSKGGVYYESLRIDKKKELLNLLKYPVAFAWIIFSYINNRLHGGSFKI